MAVRGVAVTLAEPLAAARPVLTALAALRTTGLPQGHPAGSPTAERISYMALGR